MKVICACSNTSMIGQFGVVSGKVRVGSKNNDVEQCAWDSAAGGLLVNCECLRAWRRKSTGRQGDSAPRSRARGEGEVLVMSTRLVSFFSCLQHCPAFQP